MNSPLLAPDRPLPRHRLVRLFPAAWEALLASRADIAREPIVVEWARNSWPLIVRRPSTTDVGDLALGLPLPPSAGKRRIAVTVSLDDVASVSALPTLGDVVSTAPERWLPCLRELAALAARYQMQTGVFGSLGWQWLTGLNYLAPKSDIDITWTPSSPALVEAFLADLADVDARAPMRLDGELLRRSGDGVNWRELVSRNAQVAVKTAIDVELHSRDSFVGAFS